MLTLVGATALASVPAAAEERPDCLACDEQQIGPFVAPEISTPRLERRDPRGAPVPIPVPGLDVTIRHRPGAGVWVAPAPGSANLFLNPGRERVTLDMKLDF